MEQLEYIKEKIKNKRKIKCETKENNYNFSILYKYFSKILIVIVITLILMIVLAKNDKFKQFFYKHVYETNFSFATINKLYQQKFGDPLPFINLIKNPFAPVFNEKFTYLASIEHKDGVKLTVTSNYLVPVLEDGIVIFVGDKDDYKNTVIIQQSNGLDVWYSNINNLNVKLYDYVEKGSLVGETIGEDLFLIFVKDGVTIDYREFI